MKRLSNPRGISMKGNYVDGFVIPIPKKNVKDYAKMAKLGREVWMKHGALQYFECVGDDLKGMPGCLSFKKMAKAKSTDTVFFSFIVFKSKAHRDAVNKKVMKDPLLHSFGDQKMPFDPKKMAYGGFKPVVRS